MKKDNFNEWFNELFEKTQLSNLNDSSGYGDWLKSDEDCHQQKANNMAEITMRLIKKKAIRQLIPYDSISNINQGGFSIIENENGFQSDVLVVYNMKT